MEMIVLNKFLKVFSALLVCSMLLSLCAEVMGDSSSGADSNSLDENSTQSDGIIDVLLPYDISFDIVIAKTSKTGIVVSKDFKIINQGQNDVTVKMTSTFLEISDTSEYNISGTRDLPEDGNNINIELICSSGGSSETLPMSNMFDDVSYAYYLESGGVGTFRLDGVVNEFGNTLWSDTTVKVTVCFSIETHNSVIKTDEVPPAKEILLNENTPENELSSKDEQNSEDDQSPKDEQNSKDDQSSEDDQNPEDNQSSEDDQNPQGEVHDMESTSE